MAPERRNNPMGILIPGLQHVGGHVSLNKAVDDDIRVNDNHSLPSLVAFEIMERVTFFEALRGSGYSTGDLSSDSPAFLFARKDMEKNEDETPDGTFFWWPSEKTKQEPDVMFRKEATVRKE